MTDHIDIAAPMRGDLVRIIGGPHAGQMGTLLRRNGTVSVVGLHAIGYTLVRALDGTVWSVPTTAMQEVQIIFPPAHNVDRAEGP